jgi:hypothetical protein
MTRILRLFALAGAAAASLAFAGNALAKTPQLLVSGSSSTTGVSKTVVEVKESKDDAAPAQVAIYAPAGYTTNLAQAPAGTQIGTVHADLQALQISPDAIIQADGVVLADDPTKYTSNTCVPGPHAAVWVLQVTVSGQSISVPVYLDPTSGTEAGFSAFKLVLCLSNPYEQAPPGTRGPFGAKIIDARMTLNAGLITGPAAGGSYLWRTAIVPWTVNGATANPQGRVEAQAVVNIPSSASLAAKVKTTRHKVGKRIVVTNTAAVAGQLLENGTPVAGATVTFFANGTKIGTAKTGATGRYAKTMVLKRKTAFKATIVVPTREGACVNPLPSGLAPAGCVSATVAPYTITTPTVTATPRKR